MLFALVSDCCGARYEVLHGIESEGEIEEHEVQVYLLGEAGEWLLGESQITSQRLWSILDCRQATHEKETRGWPVLKLFRPLGIHRRLSVERGYRDSISRSTAKQMDGLQDQLRLHRHLRCAI